LSGFADDSRSTVNFGLFAAAADGLHFGFCRFLTFWRIVDGSTAKTCSRLAAIGKSR